MTVSLKPQSESRRPRSARGGIEPPTLFSYVDAVARHGSIRKAAEALHMASSALNRRVLDLEDQIGSPLFERLPRGVRPTAVGELFLAFVRRSLKDMQLLEAQIDSLRGLGRGHVRIAVAESVTGHMLPDAIATYQREHPGIRFSVSVGGPKRLAKALLRDSVDMILTHDLMDYAEVGVLSAVRQPLCVWVAPEHPLAGRKSARLRDCVEYPVAMPDETLAARGLLDVALARASIGFEPALVSNSIETTKTYARKRGGVCFSFRIGEEHASSDMVAIPLDEPLLRDARLYLAYRRGRVLPVAAATFAEWLTDLLERLSVASEP